MNMRIILILALVSASLVIHATAACHWACATCFGLNQNQCNTCATSFYIQPGPAPNSTTCLPTCPAGYYGNNANGRCDPCDVSCARCSWSPVACDACAAGYTWSGAYCVGPTITCHTSCLACSGPADNQCTSCPSGFFLNANNKCRPCDASCKECSGAAANKCTACPDGKYLTATNTCAPCHADCATCSGGAANQCLSCDSAGAKPVLVGTQCYAQCTGTQRPNGIKCTTCDVSCRNNNCRDAAVNCVNCAVGYHRDNGLCVPNRRLLRE